MNRIPLETRLQRVAASKLSDPAMTETLITAVADMPMLRYLDQKLIIDFAEILDIDVSAAGQMTVGQAAATIQDTFSMGYTNAANKAMMYLYKPFFLEYRRHHRA